jgi:putative transcriptional regulator
LTGLFRPQKTASPDSRFQCAPGQCRSLAKAEANSDTIHMIEPTYLSNQFLIAMPTLADPNFYQTVTYISEHNASGALGLVINRPLSLTLGQLLEHLDLSTQRVDLAALPIYQGGPVQPEQGFVLHSPLGHWGATLRVTDQIGITTSRDILQAVACGEGPDDLLVTLGYAGWGPGQLEQELAENAWLSGPADPDILFRTHSDRRWLAAAALLGIDLNLLSADAGHA